MVDESVKNSDNTEKEIKHNIVASDFQTEHFDEDDDIEKRFSDDNFILFSYISIAILVAILLPLSFYIASKIYNYLN